MKRIKRNNKELDIISKIIIYLLANHYEGRFFGI